MECNVLKLTWHINVSKFIFKFKQNENANITNFVYYGKTRMKCNDSLVAPNKQNKERI